MIRENTHPVPRVFSLSNMAAAGEKTLAHSELKRSLIDAFHGAFIRELSLVYSFQNKDGCPLRSLWRLRSAFFSVWDLKGGQNSALIVWKTVTVPLEGKHLKTVRGFISCFHRDFCCVPGSSLLPPPYWKARRPWGRGWKTPRTLWTPYWMKKATFPQSYADLADFRCLNVYAKRQTWICTTWPSFSFIIRLLFIASTNK